MLKVYAAEWCPHCIATVKFLTEHKVPFEYVDMEKTDPETEALIVKVNGGDDWVVPTLENDGKWRPGEVFNERKLTEDLKRLGVRLSC